MKKPQKRARPKPEATKGVVELIREAVDRPHGTGLVDLGFWIELFEQHPELIKPPEKGSRRGRIWT